MRRIIYFTQTTSPLGDVLLAATESGLCGLYFHDQRYLPAKREHWQRDDDRLKVARRGVAAYFNGQNPDFDLVLDVAAGTPFQQDVWQALRQIPIGQTWSYRQLATHLGRPLAVRAVGAAVGRNPLSLIIPCHRVIGSAGALTGYAGGLDRKRWLLEHEARMARHALL